MPKWKEEIRQRLAALKLAPTREAEIVEELAQHIEDRYEELLASGVTEVEASRTALAELSESDLLSRELQLVERRASAEPVVLGANRKRNMITDLVRDLRYAVRKFRKSPGFTAVCILTLALGIGANTAIFTVLNAVMLRTLPVKDPQQLVILSDPDSQGWRKGWETEEKDVLKLVVKHGMTLALMGIAVGLLGAFALTRLMTTLLFGVTPTDAATFVVVPLCLMVVALLACYIPARRATKVNPLVALRYE